MSETSHNEPGAPRPDAKPVAEPNAEPDSKRRAKPNAGPDAEPNATSGADPGAHGPLENKVIIMNGFSNAEIARIMKSVKSLFDNPRDLIFAKTTETSLQMKLADLIEDMSEDHEYLKKNPPNTAKRRSEAEPGSSEGR